MSGASVTLKTGVQGSGKTLSAVAELAALLRRWEEHEEERRPVFVHGIRDLVCDHAQLPVYPLRGKPGDEYQKDRVGQPCEPVAVDWSQVPQGAHVIIDEAQRLFPPRPNNAPVPEHVGWFAMSRQEGCTVVLMTQAPTSIDVEVRKRCGLHQHYESRPFGFVTVKEWANQVSTSLKNAETLRPWRLDKSAFDLYKSASLHTKGAKSKIPFPVFVLGAAVLAALVVVPFAGKALYGAMTGKGVMGVAASASAAGLPRLPTPASVVIPPDAPAASASAVDPPASAAPAAPRYAGCMAMGSRCQCIDDAGYLVKGLAPHVCHAASREYGEFIPYPVTALAQSAQAALMPAGSASANDSASAAVARGLAGLNGVRQ